MDQSRQIELDIPGRVCLFGEHSDWAAGYRTTNPQIELGYAIITGTDQGIRVRAMCHPSKIKIQSRLPEGERLPAVEYPLDSGHLRRSARCSGFYSYMAGTAAILLEKFDVRGVDIDNFLTDLPLQKGLSSSAAACVMTARVFNILYDLQLDTRAEMEVAFQGELLTGSKCGRMDQGCAYGKRSILMTFDGDALRIDELTVAQPLYLLLVDLAGTKDTKAILRALNACYPLARNELDRNVHHYLGQVSADTTLKAVQLISCGSLDELGALMCSVQKQFDTLMRPACPDELAAPRLRALLSESKVRKLSLGGKGVGSQGDGTAQLLVRDERSQQELGHYISCKLGLSVLPLTIPASERSSCYWGSNSEGAPSS